MELWVLQGFSSIDHLAEVRACYRAKETGWEYGWSYHSAWEFVREGQNKCFESVSLADDKFGITSSARASFLLALKFLRRPWIICCSEITPVHVTISHRSRILKMWQATLLVHIGPSLCVPLSKILNSKHGLTRRRLEKRHSSDGPWKYSDEPVRVDLLVDLLVKAMSGISGGFIAKKGYFASKSKVEWRIIFAGLFMALISSRWRKIHVLDDLVRNPRTIDNSSRINLAYFIFGSELNILQYLFHRFSIHVFFVECIYIDWLTCLIVSRYGGIRIKRRSSYDREIYERP
jgi:hypothetical protein